MDNRLASLRRILRIHINWLTVKLLGKELVSKEELAELKDYGRLDLGDEVGLVESSFVLGRISALSKKSEYKDLTLEKLSILKKRKFSSVEKLAIREAKLHAARRLQILSDEAAAGAFARVNKATQDLIADATAKDIIQEELALAIAEKKTRKQLATSVGNKLGTDLTAGFRKLIVTEMHRAKTRGVAMAIANKMDIYSSSEGSNSIVSVVPNRGACKDCENLYLSETGDPKTFRLSDLVGQGTNADPGISHARTHGLHLGWRPVMPPAHPNCFCELVYVPAGMGWKNGKLVVVDEFKYKEQISKAVDKSTMSATIKPHGAPSNQAEKKASPPSIPGVAAPGNVAGPGATPKAGLDVSAHTKATPAPNEAAPQADAGGADIEYEYWAPRTGTPPEGKGWEQAPKSKAWRRPLGMGGEGAGEEDAQGGGAPQEDLLSQLIVAASFKAMEKPVEEMREHIQQGEVINSLSLKRGEVDKARMGINDSYKQTIKGNGSMLAKPGSSAHGSDIQREAAAYKAFTMFGSDRCPPTFVRTKDPSPASGMAWLDNYDNAFSAIEEALELKGSVSNQAALLVRVLLDLAPDKDSMVDQLSEIAVMDLVLGNSDRHVENFMLDEDFTDARAIDHGYCFEPGLNFYQGRIHEGFNSNNRHLKIPEKMKTRFENTSYGDIKKGFGDEHLQEWQTAQAYLRMKYVLHVSNENDGNLPLEEFSSVGYGFSDTDRVSGAAKFEDFMINYIDDNVANPDSPEHATAKHLDEVGIFMSPYVHRVEPKVYLNEVAEGNNFSYEKEVRSAKATAEAARNGDKDWEVRAKKDWQDYAFSLDQSEIDDAYKLYKDKRAENEKLTNELNDLEVKLKPKGVRYLNEEQLLAIPEYKKLFDKWIEFGKTVDEAEKNIEKVESRVLKRREITAMGFQLIPPGQLDKFKELDRKVQNAYANPRARKAYRMDYGTNTMSAADIEKKKIKAWHEKVGS